MHKTTLRKPDGRELNLYSRRPIPQGIEAPSPNKSPLSANPHYRWHPLRGEWVAYAAHRQNRTFLPPPEYNPLAPSASVEHPTELPVGDYDVAVFENLFPSLSMKAESAPSLHVPTEPAKGVCEVVVYSQDPNRGLGYLDLDHIELLLQVWTDRREKVAARGMKYVMPFENRGAEVGVTLHHPHSQIYAYPFIPPIPERELDTQRRYFRENSRPLLLDFLQREISDEVRVIYEGPEAVAFVPVCARYTYEVWIVPRKSCSSLLQLSPSQRSDLARALKTVLLKYDKLWNRTFPYLMLLHESPTDGDEHPYCQMHISFYPPYRTETKLKFLAGTELGAGMFASDSLPEEKAAELRRVEVTI